MCISHLDLEEVVAGFPVHPYRDRINQDEVDSISKKRPSKAVIGSILNAGYYLQKWPKRRDHLGRLGDGEGGLREADDGLPVTQNLQTEHNRVVVRVSCGRIGVEWVRKRTLART